MHISVPWCVSTADASRAFRSLDPRLFQPFTQETRVIETSEMALTRELHVIRAHHLHYTSLLDDYLKHVEFIAKNPNPALSTYTEEERVFTKTVMERECDNLVAEIKRLKDNLSMQERRLKNVMGLVSS